MREGSPEPEVSEIQYQEIHTEERKILLGREDRQFPLEKELVLVKGMVVGNVVLLEIT